MKYQDMVEQLTPELVATFKQSLELGHWPDGRELTQSQREHCMGAIIGFEQAHLPEEERVGYINKGRKADQVREREAIRIVDDASGQSANKRGKDSDE